MIKKKQWRLHSIHYSKLRVYTLFNFLNVYNIGIFHSDTIFWNNAEVELQLVYQ